MRAGGFEAPRTRPEEDDSSDVGSSGASGEVARPPEAERDLQPTLLFFPMSEAENRPNPPLCTFMTRTSLVRTPLVHF